MSATMKAVPERRSEPMPALQMRARVAMVGWRPRGVDAMRAFALALEFDRLLQERP